MAGTLSMSDVQTIIAQAVSTAAQLNHPVTVAITDREANVLAVFKMIYARRVVTTMAGVFQFFYGLLPGQTVPRIDVPADPTFTLPYAVPICFGSVLSFFLFRA